MEEKL